METPKHFFKQDMMDMYNFLAEKNIRIPRTTGGLYRKAKKHGFIEPEGFGEPVFGHKEDLIKQGQDYRRSKRNEVYGYFWMCLMAIILMSIIKNLLF